MGQVVQEYGTQPVPCTKVNISVICSILSVTGLMLNLKLQPAANELSLATANSVETTYLALSEGNNMVDIDNGASKAY